MTITTAEFRRERARLAARSRWGTLTPAERQQARRDAAERRLIAILGQPPEGSRWIDGIITNVDAAPPLTTAQRDRLALLLHTGATA